MWEQHTSGLEVGFHLSRRPYDPALPGLLCVHGAGGQGQLFRAQLAGLSRVANVAAVDLPGHGQTPGPSYESIQDYASWLADFIECGPIRPFLLGHSMGGAVAQTLALARPGLIRGLILAATSARLRVAPDLLQMLRDDYPRACEEIVSGLMAPAAMKSF
jgi:pimeloyl-ACP methyl ester carboxylesterase